MEVGETELGAGQFASKARPAASYRPSRRNTLRERRLPLFSRKVGVNSQKESLDALAREAFLRKFGQMVNGVPIPFPKLMWRIGPGKRNVVMVHRRMARKLADDEQRKKSKRFVGVFGSPAHV